MLSADQMAEPAPRCRTWVGEEDRCGEPAVAIDRDSEEPRCAPHVTEELWREAWGWVPKPRGPIEWIPA